MSFIDSFPPDITEALPAPLPSGGTLSAYAFDADDRFDVAVNGLGFLLRPTANNPYERGSEQVRKQQIDSSTEAGEQTLSSWWIRSQVSWHLGAGIKWYEPGAEPDTQYRFGTSQGVDVWTEGEVSLLHDVVNTPGFDTAATVLTFRREGVDGFVRASGTALSWTGSPSGSLTATLASGGATQPAASGRIVWVGHTDRVSKWDTTGTGTLTVPLTCTGTARVWWIKQRLFVAVGNKLYWLGPSATGEVETDGTLVAEHPDPDWSWSDVCDTPDAVLLSGFSASESAVLAVTLDATGSDPLPALSAPYQVASFPRGEQVSCMGTYLGAYVVLGTTAGVRVGVVGQGGQVQYGPLLVRTATPVADVTFRDRFAYLGVSRGLPDGSSGVVRVDLSAPVGEGDPAPFAWAFDVSTRGTGDVSSVGFVGNTDRVVVVSGGVQSVQSSTGLVARGWLETGRVRYRTTELKAFQSVKLSGVLNNGTVEVTSVTDDGNEHRVMTYTPEAGIEGEAGVQVSNRTQLPNLGFRLYLTPSDGGLSPVVSGFSVKALPTVRKGRLVKFPLSCFDFEEARHGEQVGAKGGALARVLELENLESVAAPVLVRDRRAGDSFVGLIESVQFTGADAPDGHEANFGGELTLTLRVM